MVDKNIWFSGDEKKMLTELLDGPISIAVDASDWHSYKNGTITECGKNLNHAVILTSYNSTEETVTIRNSWSQYWGEDGYIRLQAWKDMCGYTSYYGMYPGFI